MRVTHRITGHGCHVRQAAARLVAVANGLGTGLLAGQHTTADATELVRYHLDQLFPTT